MGKSEKSGLIFLSAVFIAGCGGGGGGGADAAPTTPPPANTTAKLAGLYLGNGHSTAFNQDFRFAGGAFADGSGYFVDSNGGVYRVSLSGSDSSAGGTYVAAISSGSSAQFANGQRTTNGAIAGTFAPKSSITATYTGQGNDKGTLSLNYNSQYADLASTPSIYAGTYTASSSTNGSLTFTLDAGGTLSGNSSTGCTYAGSFSIPDATKNLARVNATATCSGSKISYAGTISHYPADSSGPEAIDFIVVSSDNSTAAFNTLTKQ